MNSLENESDQLLKESNENVDRVYPCCSCYYSMSKKIFFLFLTIWDIVFSLISICSLRGSNILFSLIMIIIAVMSYSAYKTDNSFGHPINKTYANVRLFIVLFQLCIFLIIGFVLFFIILLSSNTSLGEDKILYITLGISYLFILVPLLAINVQWSLLFRKIILEAVQELEAKQFTKPKEEAAEKEEPIEMEEAVKKEDQENIKEEIAEQN